MNNLKAGQAELRQKLHLKRQSPELNLVLEAIALGQARLDSDLHSADDLVTLHRAQGGHAALDQLKSWILDETPLTKLST